MGQDLRDILRNQSLEFKSTELSENHEANFLDKLDLAFADSNIDSENYETVSLQNTQVYNYKKWSSIAASTVVSFGLGWYLLNQVKTVQQPTNDIVHIEKQTNKSLSLADMSPEFQRFEEISLATINVGLSELKINDTNRSLVKSYISELEHLKKEYKSIQLELQLGQVNTQSIEVLIENLQMQLSLLEQLKQKVKNINEYSSSNAYQNLQT